MVERWRLGDYIFTYNPSETRDGNEINVINKLKINGSKSSRPLFNVRTIEFKTQLYQRPTKIINIFDRLPTDNCISLSKYFGKYVLAYEDDKYFTISADISEPVFFRETEVVDKEGNIIQKNTPHYEYVNNNLLLESDFESVPKKGKLIENLNAEFYLWEIEGEVDFDNSGAILKNIDSSIFTKGEFSPVEDVPIEFKVSFAIPTVKTEDAFSSVLLKEDENNYYVVKLDKDYQLRIIKVVNGEPVVLN